MRPWLQSWVHDVCISFSTNEITNSRPCFLLRVILVWKDRLARPSAFSTATASVAVRSFTALPESDALAAANKRISNILKKANPSDIAATVSPALFAEPAESALAAAITAVKPVAETQLGSGDYTAALKALAALRDPVDAFFDGVMVNADEQQIRANRLALLSELHGIMNRVADLSRLAT